MSLDVRLIAIRPVEVYSQNITHNLVPMAQEAGVYEWLWRPEDKGVIYAGQLIEPLTEGLERLTKNPDHFKRFNPDNGWGDYDGLVNFIISCLSACQEDPDAKIEVSR